MRRTIAVALIAVLFAAACTSGASPSAAPTGPTAPPTEPAPPSAAPATSTPAPTPDPQPTQAPPATWAQLAATGSAPAAREDHTWTVDGDRDTGTTAWLFGGRSGSRAYADLFAYELATDTWRAVTPANAGPSARFGHEALWLPGRGLVVWAGQASATAFFNDLWLYDPAANRWTRLPNGGATPVPRYGSCSGIGPDGRLWISHGFTEDGTRFADTRAYDFATDTWADETPDGRLPVERCLHGCWFTTDGAFVLYAGQTTGVEALADLWRLDGPGTAAAAWTRVEGTLPADRNLYAYARVDGATVVVGGRGSGSTYRADAWRFADGPGGATSPTPIEIDGASPPGRAGATLIADAARGRLLLFGGKTGSDALADLWELPLT
jgi:hypothetical protein